MLINPDNLRHYIRYNQSDGVWYIPRVHESLIMGGEFDRVVLYEEEERKGDSGVSVAQVFDKGKKHIVLDSVRDEMIQPHPWAAEI